MSLAAAVGLGFAYGGSRRWTLRDVNLDIRQGDFVLVAGASGSGKSTLLRCFNGLIPHFHGGVLEGQVTVAGFDTRLHQPRELSFAAGFVFQEPEAQRVSRTVQEEIVFGMENQGLPAAIIRKRLEEALDALGIAPLRAREIHTLSGGELQRVAIASVLAMQPRLLLMDEPTSQLDPQAADDVLRIARDLRDDFGLAVVIAEHRLERVIRSVDRVWHVRGDGTVQELEPREAAGRLPGAPAVSRIGSALGWSPLPLSINEARRHVVIASAAVGDTRPAQAPGAPLVSLNRIEVELGGRMVLKVDGLRLHEGEVIGLMGRNGAGKTTLLRVLAGLQRPARGSLTGVVEDATRRYRHVAFVPQDLGASLYKERLAAEVDDVLRGTGRIGDAREALARWDLEVYGE